MTLTIKINCDNAAFDDNEAGEIARILRDLANRIDGYGAVGGMDRILHDINGNRCGTAKMPLRKSHAQLQAVQP